MCMLQGESRQAYFSTLWLCAMACRTIASCLLPLASCLLPKGFLPLGKACRQQLFTNVGVSLNQSRVVKTLTHRLILRIYPLQTFLVVRNCTSSSSSQRKLRILNLINNNKYNALLNSYQYFANYILFC